MSAASDRMDRNKALRESMEKVDELRAQVMEAAGFRDHWQAELDRLNNEWASAKHEHDALLSPRVVA